MTGATVVGVDDSPAAGLALRWAMDEALLRGSGVTIVSAWQVPRVHFNLYRPASYDHLRAEAAAEHDALARRFLDAVRTIEPALGAVPVAVTVVEGEAGEALVETSRHAALLVIGARGLGALQRALLGSTSMAVLAGAHCPVVVLRARPSQPSLGEEAELHAYAAELAGGLDRI